MPAPFLPHTKACRPDHAAFAGRLPLPSGGEGRGEGATFDIGRDGSAIFPPTLTLPLRGGGKRPVSAFPHNIEVCT